MKPLSALIALVLGASSVPAQDVLLQAWYWDYPKPGCAGHAGPSWAASMSARTGALRAAGFSHVWLPPLSKASFGDCSNGYDPRDLYDIGQYTGRTGVGTGAEVLAWLGALQSFGLQPVADVVYNHRDGGAWEDNPAVRSYVLAYPPSACSGSATPYPVNGKLRYVLALGGASLNGTGDYYFKFSSASGNTGFHARPYKLYFRTQNTPHQPSPVSETEPNGGGDCGQPFESAVLGREHFAWQEVGTGCNTDEFRIQLGPGDFLASGDQLEIYIEEPGGAGTGIDQRPYAAWSSARNADVIGELRVQTRTNFQNMPSGAGAMNFANFRPNGTLPTCLSGDEQYPFFFFDVEQAEPSTGSVYRDWNLWMWNSLGVRGLRMDAVKHFPGWFAGLLLQELHNSGRNPSLVVGEHFTNDSLALKSWIDAVNAVLSPAARAAIHVRAFDFELREELRKVTSDGLHDARRLFQSGLVDRAGLNGFAAVTFVNNHDFRTPTEHISARAMLAYAYILTNNRIGLPCVFLPDYDGTDIYGPAQPLESLAARIDALIALHKAYIAGATQLEYLNRFGTPRPAAYLQSGPFDLALYQIRGGPAGKDVIVAINFENQRLRVNHGIDTTGAPLGTRFGLAAGRSNHVSPVVENSPNGVPASLYIDLPAYSYAVYLEDFLPRRNGPQ